MPRDRRRRQIGLSKVLGQRLQRARRTAGLTQVEAARALDRPQSFISKTEAGEREITVPELYMFAEIYRTTIVDLAGPLTPEEEIVRAEYEPRPLD